VRTGLSALSSKAGNVAGNISGRVARASDVATGVVGKTVAPASNRVLKAIDRPTTIAANLAPALAAAAVYAQVKVATTGPGQGRRPGAAVAIGMRDVPDILERRRTLSQVKKGVGLAALVGSLGATAVADLTEQSEGKRKLTQRKKRLLVGEQKVEVTFAKSKLTGWLNKRNSLLSAPVRATWSTPVKVSGTGARPWSSCRKGGEPSPRSKSWGCPRRATILSRRCLTKKRLRWSRASAKRTRWPAMWARLGRWRTWRPVGSRSNGP